MAQQANGGEEEYIATFFVRAQYDYQSSDPSSLSFNKNDIIEVLSQLDSGWWDGLLGDERGWFPSNFVSVITLHEAETSLSSSGWSSGAPSEPRDSIVDVAEALGSRLQPEDETHWLEGSKQSVAAVRPSGPQAGKAASECWVPQVTADGQVYYVNTQTGQRSKELPQEADDDMSDSELVALRSQLALGGAAGKSLAYGFNSRSSAGSDDYAGFGLRRQSGTPEPWQRTLTDDGLNYYYYNKDTQEVKWTLQEPTTNGRRAGDPFAATTPSLNGTDGPFVDQGLRSDSSMSFSDEHSRDGTSTHSDDSDVYAREPDTPAATTPLQRSIAQARQNGTLELTKAEQSAETLQQAMTPGAPMSVGELSAVAQATITALIGHTRQIETDDLSHLDQQMDTHVDGVVMAVRDLLYITALPSGTVPDVSGVGNDVRHSAGGSNMHAQLKPAQRKVTATLSKLVLSVQAVRFDYEMPQADASGRIEADAVELQRALHTFVMDVQRLYRQSRIGVKRVHGVFSPDHLGQGLIGAGAAATWKGFGWVALDDTDVAPSKVLRSDVVEELKAFVDNLSEALLGFTKILGSSGSVLAEQVGAFARDIIRDFSTFLAAVANIHVAGHVDIDGIQQETGQSSAHEMYIKTVDTARSLVRMLEVATQAIFDDSAALLLVAQTIRSEDFDQSEEDRSARYDRLVSIAGSLNSNTTVVMRTIEDLLAAGSDQAAIAEGDYKGSIKWRMSRVSMLESGLRPLSTVNGDTRSVVDMEFAFNKFVPAKPQVPPKDHHALNHKPSEHSLSASSDTSGNEDMPPMTMWNGLARAPEESTASSSTTSPAVDEDDDDDDLLLTGVKRPPRKQKLVGILGAEAPKHYIETQTKDDGKPWFLRANKDPESIMLDPIEGTVKAGTVPALVERLTTHENPDTRFMQTFLMTWKSFTTFDELFDLLVERFWIEPPDGLKPNELDQWKTLKQKHVQIRVLNLLKSIVTDEQDVLDTDDHRIFPRLRAFLREDVVASISISRTVIACIDRTEAGEDSKKKMTNKESMPASIVPRTIGKKMKVTDIDPLEMARQLTLLESNLYMKIRPMECLLRAKEQLQGKPDHIADLINLTNKVAIWVADSVLSKEDSRRRATVVKHFINVADHCRKLNNFSTMVAIMSGLNGPAIRRLKRTWEQVNARTMAQLAACETTFDTNGNFNGYRSMLAKVTPPCMPFFGVYLTTLTFIQDGNPDKIGNLVNFGKRQMAADAITDVRRWQSAKYNFHPLPQVLGFIEEQMASYGDQNHEALRDQFWNTSLEREPREREDEKMARLLQESGFL